MEIHISIVVDRFPTVREGTIGFWLLLERLQDINENTVFWHVLEDQNNIRIAL